MIETILKRTVDGLQDRKIQEKQIKILFQKQIYMKRKGDPLTH